MELKEKSLVAGVQRKGERRRRRPEQRRLVRQRIIGAVGYEMVFRRSFIDSTMKHIEPCQGLTLFVHSLKSLRIDEDHSTRRAHRKVLNNICPLSLSRPKFKYDPTGKILTTFRGKSSFSVFP